MNDPVVYVDHDPGNTDEEIRLCNDISRVCFEAYPGFDWYVNIPPNQGIVHVKSLKLSQGAGVNAHWGWCVHTKELTPSLREVKIACGAVLERYEKERGHAGRFRPEDVKPRLIAVTPET